MLYYECRRLNSLESPFCIEMRGRLAGAQRPAGGWRPHPGRVPAGRVPRLLPKRTEPLFYFGHGLGYTDWTYESSVAEAIIAGQDLPLVVTVRNSGERAGRKVVQGYLEGPDDNPSSPLRALAGFSIIDAGPGEQAKARLTVPARFDEGLSQWVWNPGISRLHAGRSSRDLGVNTQVVLR